MDDDTMEWEEDQLPLDQDRVLRAAEKAMEWAERNVRGAGTKSISYEEALKKLNIVSKMAADGKITADNAFSLDGIDALSVLVHHFGHQRGNAEQNFQRSGLGLAAGVKLYEKRVDAVYTQAFRELKGANKECKDDGEDDTAQGGDDQEEGGGGGADDGEVAEPITVKAKRRTAASALTAGATLVDDKELTAKVKELSFEMDPAFTRTSRLIDDNSPAGLLLHSLPVFAGPHLAFTASIKPQELLRGCTTATQDIALDLSLLPGASELLRAAAEAPIAPGIGDMYALLEQRVEPVSEFTGEELVQKALDKLAHSSTAAGQSAVLSFAVRRVAAAAEEDEQQRRIDEQARAAGSAGGWQADGEHGGADGEELYQDAMDVDGGSEAEASVGGAGRPSQSLGGEGGMRGSQGGASEESGAWGDANGGYDSPGGFDGDFGGEDGDEDERQQAGGSQRDQQGQGGEEGDEEGEVAGLLGSLGLGLRSGSSTASWISGGGRMRWVSRARKATGAAANAAAKTGRARKVRVDEPLPDFSAAPVPDLVPLSDFCYKTRRVDVTSKVLLPRPMGRPGAAGGEAGGMFSLFCNAPVTIRAACAGADAAGPVACSGAPGPDVLQVWSAVLHGKARRAQEQRRMAQATAEAAGTGGAQPAHTGAESGVQGGEALRGGGYGEEQDAGDAYFDGGAADYGDDYGDDDSGQGYQAHPGFGAQDGQQQQLHGGAGGGGSDASRLQLFAELLQPSRPRAQRLAVKYDRTAGVADVRGLKEAMQASLRSLATDRTAHHASAAAAAPLPFQVVLDQLSAPTAAANPAASPAARPAAPPSLSGVSTHLAFICLLHLANEHGLALSNGGSLDALHVTGLGGLAA